MVLSEQNSNRLNFSLCSSQPLIVLVDALPWSLVQAGTVTSLVTANHRPTAQDEPEGATADNDRNGDGHKPFGVEGSVHPDDSSEESTNHATHHEPVQCVGLCLLHLKLKLVPFLSELGGGVVGDQVVTIFLLCQKPFIRVIPFAPSILVIHLAHQTKYYPWSPCLTSHSLNLLVSRKKSIKLAKQHTDHVTWSLDRTRDYTPVTNCFPKLSKLNFQMTLSLPCFSVYLAPFRIFHIAAAHYSRVSQRQPQPSPTDSLGPPLLSAITGTPEYMASQGTIPKCSFFGVYSTHSAFLRRYFRVWSLTDVQKCTLCPMLRVRVSSWSSQRYYMFSAMFWSQPPAMTKSTSACGCCCSIYVKAVRASSIFFFRSQRFRDKKYFLVSSLEIAKDSEQCMSYRSNCCRSIEGYSTYT